MIQKFNFLLKYRLCSEICSKYAIFYDTSVQKMMIQVIFFSPHLKILLNKHIFKNFLFFTP